MGEGGWRVVALLRLAPVVPFVALNYLLGLTPVRLGPYVLASWAAMLPATVVYVALGHLGRAGLEGPRTPAEWGLLAAGGAAAVAVVAVVARGARRALAARAPAASAPEPRRRPGWTLALLVAGLLALVAGAAVWRSGRDGGATSDRPASAGDTGAHGATRVTDALVRNRRPSANHGVRARSGRSLAAPPTGERQAKRAAGRQAGRTASSSNWLRQAR